MLDQQLLSTLVPSEESRRAINAALDVPTAYARNGRPTLTWEGVRLHSGVNPDVELEREFPELKTSDNAGQVIPETVHCVLLCPGLGYAIKALDRRLRQHFPQSRVIITVLDKDAVIVRKALHLRLWEPVRAEVRFCLMADFDPTSIKADHTITIRSTPGYRLCAEQGERALHAQQLPQSNSSTPKILVPTPIYGGSLPIATHCAKAFGELGCDVELLDLSPYHDLFQHVASVTNDRSKAAALQNILISFLSQLIVTRAVDMGAHLVWAVAQTPLSTAALQELRNQRIRTALWFVEDYETLTYWRQIASAYDHVFTIQRGVFHQELRELGAQNVHYLPMAADPSVHTPLALSKEEHSTYGSATSFVGAGYLNRRHVFEQAQLGDFAIWGNDWPEQSIAYKKYARMAGRRVSTEECTKIYNASTININLHSSNKCQGVNLDGDFVNPRTFEIAACGAFQLVDERKELSELFELGRELVTFKSMPEMERLTEYYLQHPDERKDIAKRARARVLRDHTYVRRMQEALGMLHLIGNNTTNAKKHDSIAALKSAAGDDQDILDFLNQFDEHAVLTIDDFAAHIYQGSGDLTRAEALFLMMKEFRDWGRERGVIA